MKQSESNIFIALSNFSSVSNKKDFKNINENLNISKIIQKTLSSNSGFLRNFKILRKKIKSLLKKKIKRNFLSHIEYIKIAVQELRPMNLNIQFESANDCIIHCISNNSLK